MRPYGQYCGLALALDRLGERWTLLIVRELLTGPKRFSDLAWGLPGIATNLLSTRLKSMVANGIVQQRDLPPPAACTAYELTPRGRQLEDVVYALVRWGGQYMPRRSGGQEFRAHWVAVAVQALLGWTPATDPPIAVAIELPEGAATLRFGDDVRIAALDEEPDVRICGRAELVIGLVSGALDWGAALAAGLHVIGSETGIEALRSRMSYRCQT